MKETFNEQEELISAKDENLSSESEEINNEIDTNREIDANNETDISSEEKTEINLDALFNKMQENMHLDKQKIKILEEKLVKLQAEFDNYRKRTQREKEELSDKAINQTSKIWLPLIDNLERAVKSPQNFSTVEEALAGINLIYKQGEKILTDLSIEKIPTLGLTFDPVYHEAIAHTDMPDKGEQEVVEVFEQGYKRKEQIVRLSVVKVAN